MNFPMIQYNGESEFNIQTKQGKIEFKFEDKILETEPALVLKFNGLTYTIPELSKEVLHLDPLSEPLTNPGLNIVEPLVPVSEITIETPDNLKVTFKTEDRTYKHIFRVFEIRLEAEAQEFIVLFPAKSAAKNIQYLEFDYKPPAAEPIIFQIPGLPYKKETMKPGRTIRIITSLGKVTFDFPRYRDWTRDNMRIIYTLKSSGKSFTFDCPFLNLAGFQQPVKKSVVVGRRGIPMHTVEGRLVTVEVEGDPEETLNLDKPLIATALHFNVDKGQTTTFRLADRKRNLGRKYMELVYIQPGDKPITLSLTGIPPIEIDPDSDSEKTLKIKAEQGIVIFDMPRPNDESRSGIRFDLLLMNEERKSYEVNGLILKPTNEKVDLSKFKYSLKTRNVFKCREGKRVEFLTIGEPGTGNPLRILEATFDIPNIGNVAFQITQPTIPGTEHPKWLQLIYTGKDGTQLVFEIPGIPNETSEGGSLGRTITFHSIVPNQGNVTLSVPGLHSKPTDIFDVHFLVTGTKEFASTRFDMKDFSFDTKIKISNDPFGRSFSSVDGSEDSEEHPEGTSKNVFYHPGWKIQYQLVEPNVTLEHEDDIFYGLGNCPYQRVTISDLMKAGSPSKIIKFYLTVLRTECLTDKFEYIRSLITTKHLEISGKFLRVPPRASILKKPKLNHDDAQRLSSAFEMEVVTNIFVEEMMIPDMYPVNPIGSRISRSANFLTNLAMSYIKKCRANSHVHFIHLSRHLLTTLKAAFMKLVQDKVALEDCKECKSDKKINHSDRLQLMGLMQFVIHGMGPVELGTMDTWAAFRHFFKANVAAIESRIK